MLFKKRLQMFCWIPGFIRNNVLLIYTFLFLLIFLIGFLVRRIQIENKTLIMKNIKALVNET